MLLNDKIDFYGVFSSKSLDKNNNVIDEYTEKNLIMDTARNNMAQIIGGASVGEPINKFVIGTLGHVGTNILDPKQVGTNGFDSTRTYLFSEEAGSGAKNYSIGFTVSGTLDETLENVEGTMFEGTTQVAQPAEQINTVRRVISDRTITYTVTIPAAAANDNTNGAAIAYTEAALYSGDEMFSMKTFPARVKEDTVKFEITWAIIF